MQATNNNKNNRTFLATVGIGGVATAVAYFVAPTLAIPVSLISAMASILAAQESIGQATAVEDEEASVEVGSRKFGLQPIKPSLNLR